MGKVFGQNQNVEQVCHVSISQPRLGSTQLKPFSQDFSQGVLGSGVKHDVQKIPGEPCKPLQRSLTYTKHTKQTQDGQTSSAWALLQWVKAKL